VFTVYIGGVLINVVYVSSLSGVVKYFLNTHPVIIFLLVIQSVVGGVSNFINNRSVFFLDMRSFLVFFSLVLIRRMFLIVKISENVLGSLTRYK